MRKRFVRLALIAVVVLVAFLMYRSTEGFAVTIDPTDLNIKCADDLISNGIRYTTARAKNQRTDKDYTCVFPAPISDRKKQLKKPLEFLPEAKCAANFQTGSWVPCPPHPPSSTFLQGVNENHRCYTCTAPALPPKKVAAKKK